MSRTYRLMCLSHDPAIDADAMRDWNNRADAEHAATVGIWEHETCDVLILEYSGGLIEIGCPKRTRGHDGGRHPHETVWADVAWLRLLALAQRAPEGSVEQKLAGAPILRCWTPQRLRRLRNELALPEGAPQ